MSFIENAKKLKERKKYTGVLTVGSVKRMTKAIDLLISSSPQIQIVNPVTKRHQQFRLSFVTLTFPAAIKLTESKEAKSILEQMLRFLRRKHNMKSYVWKAEVTKKGQIHFHLTSNVYIHFNELRNYWNRLLVRSTLFDDYFKERGNSDINSTDIHSVRKIKDLSAYLMKYFTKQYQNEVPIKGKVWDCSENLKAAGYFETDMLEEDYFDLNRGVAKGDLKAVEIERCTIFISGKKHMFDYVEPRVIASYHQYLYNVYQGFKIDDVLKVSSNLLDSCIENRSLPKDVPKQLYLFN